MLFIYNVFLDHICDCLDKHCLDRAQKLINYELINII